MDKATRNTIERATQQARKLLDEDFSSQLEGTFDVLRSGVIASNGGPHLSARQGSQRDKIVAAIEYKSAAGMTAAEAVTDYVRDAAFTTLNRFVALKMLEARELVQKCITNGEQSAGYREFCGMAPGVALLPDAAGYRLYIESLFDEFSTEIKALFDRRDAASVLWPKRQTFEVLLAILNAPDLSGVWDEDETIGWVYQFFNIGEERKKMREDSQAPRNSRELAVRNQFFTPRYVVQFLTDNTLGRIWLGMHGHKTCLTTLCEYLVRSVDESAQPRPRKDPRDLRILDPACGSGHFLLYSFDLLLPIYEEAWSVEGAAPRSETTGRTLRDDYPDLVDLSREVPRLVVEENLFGVDIDPRCAQIAALALWLRAQRAWKDLGVAASERPRIHRTHIVVAEPMPGDAALVDEFAGRLDPPLLRDLFKKMIDESRLAGELGVLLRVEDGIAAELCRAREQFVKQRQSTDFLPGMESVATQGALDLSGIDDDGFFHEAETRIVEALRTFAETATGSAGVRRQLFAGDAAQGIALIDLVRTRFDVALMNPPFGLTTERAYEYIQRTYPGSHNDCFATFVARSLDLATSGLVGTITSRGFLVAPRMEDFRKRHFLPRALLLADLGLAVMDDAFVESCAYVLDAATSTTEPRPLVAFDLRTSVGKEAGIAHWHEPFCADRQVLEKLPKSRVLYSLPDRVFSLLRSSARFEPAIGTAREGMKTFDNFRFLRLRWEVDAEAIGFGADFSWTFLAKGGAFAFYVGITNVVVNWSGEGRELQEINVQKNGSTAQVRQASSYWGRAGVTFSGRSAKGFSARALPAGHIISGRGPAILSESRVSNEYLLGWLNARLIRSLIHLQASASYFATGIIKQLPWVALAEGVAADAVAAARTALRALLNAGSLNEVSPYFVGPVIRPLPADGLAETRAILEQARALVAEAMRLWDIAIDNAYGLDSSTWAADLLQSDGGDEDDEDGDDAEVAAPLSELQYAQSLVSYTVGCAFGRWDSSGLNRRDELLNSVSLFETLPSAGLGASASVRGTRAFVDDPGSGADLIEHVELLLRSLNGPDSDVLEWICARLGAADLRAHFRGVRTQSFFSSHLDRYSRSRRKVPVYWQLTTSSASYSVWLYLHAFTNDTLYKVQNDYVAPKLAHEERRLESLRRELGESPKAAERKTLAAQETFVEELRVFLDEVKRVAPLWNPNLDDGVIINFAPLWRLVPHHKVWQKELKATWEALCAGDYDWSHLAMHLWPERVVPKCATDRSFAIAHGLEDVFWVEGDYGKWKSRPALTRQVDELVCERTSMAVKSALKTLLEAPAANANGGRGRGRRTASAAANGGAR